MLDKYGNIITKEQIEEMYCEQFKDQQPFMQRYEWEEDGHIYHSWKIRGPHVEGQRDIEIHTNDAGAEMMNEAMKKWVNENYKP